MLPRNRCGSLRCPRLLLVLPGRGLLSLALSPQRLALRLR